MFLFDGLRRYPDVDCEVLQEIYVKGDDTVSGLKSFNTLGFATILCDKFILAGEFVKGMIMKDDLRLGSH